MGFWDRVAARWQSASVATVHGWLDPVTPAAAPPAAGTGYLRVLCTDLSVRYDTVRGTDRRPLLQSLVRWPYGAGQVTVSSTLGAERFKELTQAQFQRFTLSDNELTGALPMNEGRGIDVSVALLAVPGTSLFDRAAKLLGSLADLTKVPQLTAAAPVAEKILGGIDSLLGNDDTDGLLAFATTINSNQPKAGYYVITDWPAGTNQLSWLRVNNSALELRYTDGGWKSPVGLFNYVVLEFRVEGSKNDLWKSLPQVKALFEGALDSLAKAKTTDDVAAAGTQMLLAANLAWASEDLSTADARNARLRMVEEWNEARQVKNATTQGVVARAPLDPAMESAADAAVGKVLSIA